MNDYRNTAQDAASEYLPKAGESSASEDLTYTILNSRRDVLEDRDLSEGAKLVFVYHRAVKERQIKKSPGQYAVDLWKRWGGKLP